MRATLTIAAFTIAAFLPTSGHAEAGDAGDGGDSGATSAPAAGAPAATGGTSGSAGTGGAKGGSSGAPGPGINLPDPGTDDSNSCSFSAAHHPVGAFATTLALGAAFLTLRRRRRAR